MILYLILGFVLLLGGASILVSGASSLGRRAGIPDIVTGLTIVALGTSAPELIISIFASLEGSTDLAVSNVIGSNIINVFVIIGISAIIHPVTASKMTTWRDVPISFFITLVLVVLAGDALLFGFERNVIGFWDSVIFLILFGGFIFYSLKIKSKENDDFDKSDQVLPIGKSILFTLIGLAALFFGGRFTVDSSVELARYLGMDEATIGLTVVATATSLPELVTSAVAAFRKNADIAIGNVIGSNIFNILLILGVSGLITPLPFEAGQNQAGIAMILLSNVFLIFFLLVGNGRKVSRIEGGIMLCIYAAYLYYLLWMK